MTSAFCRTLVLIAAGAALPAAGMLQAEPVPGSPELPTGLTSRVAPPRLAPDRFTAEGPLEAAAVPLDGWTVVWPGQKPEDKAGSTSGITIARTNTVIGGQPFPALQFTFTRGTYKTRPLIELAFPFNADIWNVFAFKAKVETSAGLQPLGFGIDMPRYGYDAGWFNKYYDNFGVSVYDGKFDWTAVAVPTTHFLYHVDRHDPGVDGFKDFQWDMRYDDHSYNKGFVRDRAKSLRFFYETRNLPADATVVVTIAAPVLAKGAHIRFSEPERFASWTDFAATYKADLSDSSRYLGPPATGRLAKPIPLARNGKALAEIVCDFSDDILIARWFPNHAQSVELLRAGGFERDVASLAARELKHWLDEIAGANFPLRLKPGARAWMPALREARVPLVVSGHMHAWRVDAPADKKFQDRQSRHYYDVVRMYEHGLGKAAMKDTGRLLEVARHKEVFFPTAWARYADARPGTLRLVPPDDRLPGLEQDYRRMQEMIFGEPPTFKRLLEVLREVEQAINLPASI